MADPASAGMRGRIGWGIADQALSSLTNFLLGVIVARSVSAEEFGAFSIAYSIFVLVIGVSRAATSEPLMVRYTAADRASLRSATSSAMGINVLIGVIGGIGCLIAGIASTGTTRGELVALGIFLPGLLLQDCWRFAFVAAGRSHLSFLNDLVYLLLMIPAAWALHVAGTDTAGDLIAVWGAAATIAGVGASIVERVGPSMRHALSWLRSQGDLSYRYVGEFVAVTGALQITMFSVVAAAGLTAVGALRGGFLLFGPVLVIFQGSMLVFIPESVRILNRSTTAFRRAINLLDLGLIATTATWGLLLEFLPDQVGDALLGSSWEGASVLVIPLTIMFAGSGVKTAATVGLRALGAAQTSLRARLIEAVLTVVGGTLGAILGGASGAAWWLAGTFWVEAAIWWWSFHTALERHVAPEPSPAA
jgi:O-antigen/teichoic acid export membrane protein